MYIRVVVVGLIPFILGSCSDSGGGGRGPVRVLEDAEAMQASAQVAVSLGTAIVALVGDSGVSPDGLSSLAEESSTPNVSRRAIRVDCPQGGSVDGDCRAESGRTIVTTSSHRCAVVESGVLATASGRLTATYERGGLCGTSSIPRDIPYTFEFEDFREELRLDGDLVRSFSASRLTETVRPRVGGCSTADGVLSLRGDARVIEMGSDMTLRMDGLRLDVASSGNPCAVEAVATGVVDVEDRGRGSRFVASLDQLRVSRRRRIDGFAGVEIDGVADVDCLGAVGFSTVIPLVVDGSCPIEGELEISVGEAAGFVAVYSGGVAIHLDGDDSADFVGSDCSSDSLAVCG